MKCFFFYSSVVALFVGRKCVLGVETEISKLGTPVDTDKKITNYRDDQFTETQKQKFSKIPDDQLTKESLEVDDTDMPLTGNTLDISESTTPSEEDTNKLLKLQICGEPPEHDRDRQRLRVNLTTPRKISAQSLRAGRGLFGKLKRSCDARDFDYEKNMCCSMKPKGQNQIYMCCPNPNDVSGWQLGVSNIDSNAVNAQDNCHPKSKLPDPSDFDKKELTTFLPYAVVCPNGNSDCKENECCRISENWPNMAFCSVLEDIWTGTCVCDSAI
eukprot:scaffold41317_cov47-Attheya_sp.AAC.1